MLPSKPHPAVNAFTNALKSDSNDCGANDCGANHGRKRTSEVVRKATQSLGWRNRFSQSHLYPVELNYNYNSGDKDGVICRQTKTIEVRQVQRGEIENTYGTGATVWPASIVLLKYLEHISSSEQSNENLFRNNNGNRRVTIADLGSGTGVTSIAAAFYLGMDESRIHEPCPDGDEKSLIVCTDGIDSVVELAKENIAKVAKTFEDKSDTKIITDKKESDIFHLGQNKVIVRKYLWGDGSLTKELVTDDKECNQDNLFFDIILVSDCVLPKLYPIEPLVSAIDELTGPSTIAYISYEYRYYPDYDPKDHFVQLANLKGLEVETIPTESQHPVYSVEDIEIWEVRRRKET